MSLRGRRGGSRGIQKELYVISMRSIGKLTMSKASAGFLLGMHPGLDIDFPPTLFAKAALRINY